MISLYDILEASNGQLFGEPAAQIFTSFCLDSRQAKNAQLYVALKTDRGDTHQYMREAVENGALGLLCTQPPDFDTSGISVILVRDTEDALMKWSHYVLGKFGTHVIGVTGTAGKSSAVDLISRVLGVKYKVHHSDSDTEGRLGVPVALAKLTPDHRYVVLELAPTQPGELAEMVQAVRPDVGVISRVGYTHYDVIGTPEQMANEMRVLLEYLSPTSLAVLNYDDETVAELASKTRAKVRTIGIDRFGADMMAYNVVVGPTGTGFDLRYASERLMGKWVPLLGKHQLYNVLIALAVGQHYDVNIDAALKALTTAHSLPGRMNSLVGTNDCVLIDDAYSANPQSTLAALNWLEEVIKVTQQRAIFVMGDMDNLGFYNQRGHRLIGQAAAKFAHLIITEGMDAALVARAALDEGIDTKKVRVTYSIEDVATALRRDHHLSDNDIVLIKGGTLARMELLVKSLLKNPDDSKQLPRQDFTWDSAAVFQPMRPSWVEIDTNILGANVRKIKELVGNDVTLMAVVKSDAYGHGLIQCASTALANGAEYLGVSSVAEALELREEGITAPILVMNYTPVYAVRQAVRQDVSVVLYDLDLARAFDRAARELGKKLKVHIKLDTGMARLGVMAGEVATFFRHLLNLRHLEIEGVYTDFATADSDADYTAEQAREFRDSLKPLRAAGYQFKYTHAANTAGVLASSEYHFNMVRVGAGLYGVSPSESVKLPSEIKPVLSWKTVVAQVRTLARGSYVGYGKQYRTRGDEQIAILPVGYGDGFRRTPQNWGEVLIHGQRAPLVGMVSMEKAAVNVSHIPNVSIGDEVVLIGKQGDQTITVAEVAGKLGTIPYEVLTQVLPRVTRR
jgi:Alr-MurF fusion protein